MFYNWFLGCKFLDSSITLQRLYSDFFVWTSLTLQLLDSGVLRTQSINIFSFKTFTILQESSSHLSCTCCWFPKLYFQVETSTLNMSKIHRMSMFCLPHLPPPSKSFRSSRLVANSLPYVVDNWMLTLDLSFSLTGQHQNHLFQVIITFYLCYYNTFLKGFSVFTSLHIISQ